jgi:NADP-dependent aldehyde dehydrogenase
MSIQPVLINGEWRQANHKAGTFRAMNPATGESLAEEYPISDWADLEAALAAAATAFVEMAAQPPSVVADFLEKYAQRLADNAQAICAQANLETALPVKPRLAEAEMPRTINQLKQAAAAAREGTWRQATIDSAANIRSCFGPLGPVLVMGPNNFPLAFNGISGGDFAAAIAAGNPVIAKAHPSHPKTSQMMAEQAHEAAKAAGLPKGAVQMIYKMPRAEGEKMMNDPRLASAGFTGSRPAGMALKKVADAAGKPIYLEMSSVNPIVFLPSVMKQKRSELVGELATSALMGSGQFCTSPNLFILFAGDDAEAFLRELKTQLESRPVAALLSEGVRETLAESVSALQKGGAELVTGGAKAEQAGVCYKNTLLRVSGKKFLENPHKLQTEAFGNATTAVVVDSVEQAQAVCRQIEGSLTACIYSAADGSDDKAYDAIAPILRRIAGRLLNDKMPTGVAVSIAMNHGGPFPATGHPGFTAVGIPAALRRFAMLECYDAVRPGRLPAWLRDEAPGNGMWRYVDGAWSQGAVAKK